MFRLNNWVPFGVVVAVLFLFGQLSVGQEVSCSSDDGHRHHCSADTRRGVQLLRQRSGSPCTQGYSWGYDRNRIWVDHGCRADFLLGNNPGNNLGNNPGNNQGAGSGNYCSSDDGQRHYCSFDTSNGVKLVNQRSDSPCQQGYSWDYDRNGIWVDHGCRAEFSSGFAWENTWDRGRGWGKGESIIACSSDDTHQRYCSADTSGGVRLIQQRSEAECRRGYSWGYDDRGVWVDHGCRADFEVGKHWEGRRRDWDDDRGDRNQGQGQSIILPCSSDDGRRRYCTAEVRWGVSLIKQRSENECRFGYSWGYDNQGVWVDHGCRADFRVGR